MFVTVDRDRHVRQLVWNHPDDHRHEVLLVNAWNVTTGTPDEGCCSPLPSHPATRSRPADASFENQFDNASSRQFESQPAETPGLYEHTLNAPPSIHQAVLARRAT